MNLFELPGKSIKVAVNSDLSTMRHKCPPS